MLDHGGLIVHCLSNDNDTIDLLSQNDFDQAVFVSFKKDYDAAAHLTREHSTAGSLQKEKRILFQRFCRDTRQCFMKTRRIARSAFSDDSRALALLSLNGSCAGNYPGWVPEAEGFYNQLIENPDLSAVMARYAVKMEVIAKEAGMLKELESIRRDQVNAMGTVKALKTQRDQALRTYNQSLLALKNILGVALRDHPEHLSKMKLKPKKQGRPKKVSSRKKVSQGEKDGKEG